MNVDNFFLFTVKNDRVVLKYTLAGNNRVREIDSLEDALGFLKGLSYISKIPLLSMKLYSSSSMDFPEDSTSDVVTQELALKIRSNFSLNNT